MRDRHTDRRGMERKYRGKIYRIYKKRLKEKKCMKKKIGEKIKEKRLKRMELNWNAKLVKSERKILKGMKN